MLTLQKYLRVLAALDILLFFAVVVGSGITEKLICKEKYIDLPFFKDLGNNTEQRQDSYNKTLETHNTIWDYRHELLDRAVEKSTEAYHIAYISMWAFIVIYVIVEVWLYCTLIIGIIERRMSSCKKWLIWRILILAVTFALNGYEIFTYNQITCTGAIAVPYGIFRLLFIFIVIEFMSKIKNSESTNAIIMIGSEKL